MTADRVHRADRADQCRMQMLDASISGSAESALYLYALLMVHTHSHASFLYYIICGGSDSRTLYFVARSIEALPVRDGICTYAICIHIIRIFISSFKHSTEVRMSLCHAGSLTSIFAYKIYLYIILFTRVVNCFEQL